MNDCSGESGRNRTIVYEIAMGDIHEVADSSGFDWSKSDEGKTVYSKKQLVDQIGDARERLIRDLNRANLESAGSDVRDFVDSM